MSARLHPNENISTRTGSTKAQQHQLCLSDSRHQHCTQSDCKACVPKKHALHDACCFHISSLLKIDAHPALLLWAWCICSHQLFSEQPPKSLLKLRAAPCAAHLQLTSYTEALGSQRSEVRGMRLCMHQCVLASCSRELTGSSGCGRQWQ